MTMNEQTPTDIPQDFLDGYALGFRAAKHHYHLPTVEEAWENRDTSRANGHLPAHKVLTDV